MPAGHLKILRTNMPQDWNDRDFLHFLISLFCMGTFVQLVSAALIYSHSLSKIIASAPIQQPELITTFLYLFVGGTVLQLYSAFSINNNGYISSNHSRSHNPELSRNN